MAKKTNKRSDFRNEDAELEQSYRKVSGKYGKKKKKKSHAGAVVLTCILVLVLTAGILFGCSSPKLEDGYIMEGVSVAGVDIGGMSKEDAVSALRLGVGDLYSTTTMVIHIGAETVELTPALSELTFNPELAVEAAYAMGRTGSKAEQKEQQLQAMTTGLNVDISEALGLNAASMEAILDKLCENFSSALDQSYYEITGERPDLQSDEEPEQPQMLVLYTGTPEFEFDLDLLVEQVMEAFKNGVFELDYECEMIKPDELDLDAIYTENCSEPVDAVMDEQTYEVSEHAYGYSFDLEAAKLALAEANYGETLEFPFVRTAPEKKQKELQELLFRDVLSSYTATQSSGSNRATNLRLACQAINGTVLLPGETFDYNEVVGERTPERGYKEAAAYMGNETITTYGGGVCQPSSVIYYCALMADLEIVTRHCHTFASSYVPLGMDATVSWGGPHFRFRNNTEYPIRIDASASGGSVTIKLVGTDDKDYYVKMEYEVLATYGWEEEYKEMDADNPKGYDDGDVITTPYTGYSVRTYRCKYSKADDSLIERKVETDSYYSSRNKVIAKITEETTEETTAPTEPSTGPSIDPDPSTPESSETTTAPTETEATQPPAETGETGSGGGITEG